MNDQLIHSAFESIAAEAGPAPEDWAAVERRIRRQLLIKTVTIATVSIAVIVAAVIFVPRLGTAKPPRGFASSQLPSLSPGSPTYTDDQNLFEVTYPSSWTLSNPKGPGFPILTSPNRGDGAVVIAIAASPGVAYTHHGCSVPSGTDNVTSNSLTETIAGETALKCEQVIAQDGTQQYRVTYAIDWTGRRAPGSPSCSRPNMARTCGDQDSLSFIISAPTSRAWSEYGATAEEIVLSLTWSSQP
jgi:hypothetical protein